VAGQALPHCRVFLVDERGQLTGAISLDCADDETAKERAQRLMDAGQLELWRLIALFKSDNPPIGET
jgi:hypothetical protein